MKLSANKTCFGQKVRINLSGETGTVMGYSQQMRQREPQFYVEYLAADGRATEAWLHQSQITELKA